MERKQTSLFLLFIFIFSLIGTACAQEALIVYGNNFSFKVSEPSGWRGITSDASKHQVNLYFPMPGYAFNSSPVLMYVRVLNKNGNTVRKSIELDMADFSQRKQKIAFFDFPVQNLNYEYASKKYLINDNQSDYLYYIDPGPSSPNYLIFVLTGPKATCEQYLYVFKELLASFRWLNLEVRE
jgi:hypothetical protein